MINIGSINRCLDKLVGQKTPMKMLVAFVFFTSIFLYLLIKFC